MFIKYKHLLIGSILLVLPFVSFGCSSEIKNGELEFCYKSTNPPIFKAGEKTSLAIVKAPFPMLIERGSIEIQGETPPPIGSVTASNKIIVTLEHRDKNNIKIEERHYTVKVRQNGRIRRQSYPFEQMQLDTHHYAEIFAQSQKELHNGTLSTKLRYTPDTFSNSDFYHANISKE